MVIFLYKVKQKMSYEELSPLSPAVSEAEHTVPEASIAELAAQLELDPNSELQEIRVWGVGVMDVEPGKVGALSTAELNGCHVSVIVGKYPNGKRTFAMTHFPPSLARDRYKRSVQELSTAMGEQAIDVDQVVTVVDSKKYPDETSVLGECFPDSNMTEFLYDSRLPGRSSAEDAGRVLAVLDYRNPIGPQLHLATEVGAQSIPLSV
jgi:hypothetical protein